MLGWGPAAGHGSAPAGADGTRAAEKAPVCRPSPRVPQPRAPASRAGRGDAKQHQPAAQMVFPGLCSLREGLRVLLPFPQQKPALRPWRGDSGRLIRSGTWGKAGAF